jgi:hypothetical protein
MVRRFTRMDEKISLKAVDRYSEAYASKIGDAFFSRKEKITGAEILVLCDIQQINLFVIRELLHAWKSESEKLKSPYFNYQAEEVVEALGLFQNTLSNHISIAKMDFLSLLKKAVSQTLYVVLDPYDFYSDALDRQGHGSIQVQDLKSDIKYLRINRAPLEKLVQKLEGKRLTTVSGNEAFALLDSILEEVSFTPEDIDGYLNQFSHIVPLALEKLYESKLVNKSTPKKEVSPPPVIQKTELFRNPIVESVEKGPKTLADNFHRIDRIRDSLTINQKFMFTKILFHGDFEIFSRAIDRLDTLDNLGQAMIYLEKDYPEWDQESEEYVEFMELVKKRFA